MNLWTKLKVMMLILLRPSKLTEIVLVNGIYHSVMRLPLYCNAQDQVGIGHLVKPTAMEK